MLNAAEQEEMMKLVGCLAGHKVKFRKLLLSWAKNC